MDTDADPNTTVWDVYDSIINCYNEGGIAHPKHIHASLRPQ